MKQLNLSLLLLLGGLQFVFAQEDCERSHCKWAFFELEETIEGTVIYHESGICGHRGTTSITILKVKNETIRVLSSCDNRSYNVGEKIYATLGGSISGLHFTRWVVGIPIKKKKGWKKVYKEAQAQSPTRFDQLVLKTTIGSLSDQSDCERRVFKPLHHNSFQCDWKFFEIEQAIEGTIVKYEAQTQPCHLIGYASLAIIALNNNQDTIRVLDYCNASTFKEGEQVVIEAGEYKKPISIPYSKTREGDEDIYRSNEFDTLIFKTTYGKIINKE